MCKEKRLKNWKPSTKKGEMRSDVFINVVWLRHPSCTRKPNLLPDMHLAERPGTLKWKGYRETHQGDTNKTKLG